MSAVVKIYEVNGASTGSETDITSGTSKFCTVDQVAPTDNPMIKPGTGLTNYSYKKSYRLGCTVAPTGSITNIKWYLDGANGFATGITVQAKTSASYSQATGTPGTTGAQMTGGADAFSYTSASPLSVPGTLNSGNTTDRSNVVEVQAVIADTASAGSIGTETATWRYDET
jgi:hypothetical protein